MGRFTNEIKQRVKEKRPQLVSLLEQYMGENDLSIAELARYAGIPRDSISRVIRGASYPSQPTLDAIGKAMHRDMSDFYVEIPAEDLPLMDEKKSQFKVYSTAEGFNVEIRRKVDNDTLIKLLQLLGEADPD